MRSAYDQSNRGRRVIFWIPWVIDLVAALVFVYFFFVGLADGSVSSFNIGLWVLVLCIAGVVVVGSLALRTAGRTLFATVLVMRLASFPLASIAVSTEQKSLCMLSGAVRRTTKRCAETLRRYRICSGRWQLRSLSRARMKSSKASFRIVTPNLSVNTDAHPRRFAPWWSPVTLVR